MAVNLHASGSQSMATIGQEKTLTSPTDPGTYVLYIDTVNNGLAAGDVLEVRIYGKVLAASTARVIFFAQFHGAQPTDDAIKVSVPASTDGAGGLSFRMTQTFGTARTLDWSVLKHS